jgi:hypothetical protein
MNVHGARRMTANMDVAVEFGRLSLTRPAEAFESEEYRQGLPVPRPRPRRCATASYMDRGKVPRGVHVPDTQSSAPGRRRSSQVPGAIEDADRAKRVTSAGALRLPITSIDDCFQMKNRAGRRQDRSDVESLERIEIPSRETSL